MRALAREIEGLELPAIEKISERQAENPFQVLIATLLSARTQDATTLAASTRLFKVARTPRTLARLTVKQIERLIYPVSFYRHKAKHVKATCVVLLDRFKGRVPSTLEDLLVLPGVGRKTANLVLILAFRSLRNICVDTHVHRISNRLGWVRTRTPEQTEHALYAATDDRWWPYIGRLLPLLQSEDEWERRAVLSLIEDFPREKSPELDKAVEALRLLGECSLGSDSDAAMKLYYKILYPLGYY